MAVYLKALNGKENLSKLQPSNAYNIPLTTLKDSLEECLSRSIVIHPNVIWKKKKKKKRGFTFIVYSPRTQKILISRKVLGASYIWGVAQTFLRLLLTMDEVLNYHGSRWRSSVLNRAMPSQGICWTLLWDIFRISRGQDIKIAKVEDPKLTSGWVESVKRSHSCFKAQQ